MKILFLDVDGVLNPLHKSLGSNTFSKVACGHVSTMLIKDPNIRIVVSSAWRRWGLEGIREILKENGIDPIKVIDITTMDGGLVPENRDKQIDKWLKEHPEIVSYVIVDDYQIDGFDKHQVKTNGYIGFTKTDMEAAMSILSAASKPA